MTWVNKLTGLLLVVIIVGFISYVLASFTKGWNVLPDSLFWRAVCFFSLICFARIIVKRTIYNNGKIKIVKKD